MSSSSPRRAAIATARAILALKPVYLDTETTGLDEHAEIVDICLLDHDGAVLVDTLVRPQARIPADAIEVHGITDAMVAKAPTWREVWPRVADAMRDRPVAIYNMDYDVRLLRQSHRRRRMRWADPAADYFCIMLAYAQFCGKWNAWRGSYRWQKLADAGRQCRISLPNAHRARADAELAREVLLYMGQRRR